MKAKQKADLAAYVATRRTERRQRPCVVCESPDVGEVNACLLTGGEKPYIRKWLEGRGLVVTEEQMKRHAGQHVQG